VITLVPKWVWAVLAAIAVLLGFQYCRSRNADKQADTDVAHSVTVDSSHKAQTAASAKVDTVIDTVWLAEKTHKAQAGSASKAADTAGRLASTLRDSSSMWHLRWQLRGVALSEDSLALLAADRRADSLLIDRNRWHLVADSAVTSQDRLRKDLAIARGGCQILPYVPCLSRKQTAIMGAVTGVMLYARYRR
jgi:hypothetical protein